jgi:hypothetical protein
MPAKAQYFITITIVSGCLLVASCVAGLVVSTHSPAFWAVALLALVASVLKVHLPGITGTISVNFVFILVGIAVFSFAETVLLAAAACVIQCLWRSRRRPTVVQVSFNVASLALSSGMSYRVGHAVMGSRESNLPVLLAVSACLYFASNTLMVSGVLALLEGKSLFHVWQQCYLWAFPYYLVGAGISGWVVAAGRTMGWAMALLIVPTMFLVYVFYRLCVQRLVQAGTSA